MITPLKNHRFVELLCAKIVPEGKPVRVSVVTDPNAKANECFFNVKEKIVRDGGEIKYGWCIWELPGLFIEAEVHSVWVSPANQLIDVTPKLNQVSDILFLPDSSVTYHESDMRRRDNVRMAVKDHPVIHKFLQKSEEYVRYLEESTDPTNPRLMNVDPTVMRALAAEKLQLQAKIEMLKVERNDMCRCGSAEKYKKCCGR